MNPFLGQLIACARVNADGTAAFARGCATALPGGAGTGIYTVTMPANSGADAANCIVHVDVEGADIAARYAHTTDLVKTITLRTIIAAPAAVDGVFNVSIWRV